ncbi:LuxR C-terminal-related transcriptional regulator [Actinoplanes sp. NPDC049548]|uniref:LuxR C-terminal-related transcriptional regulator n=1 Tax=Actinoplanes sp. NPDC049548 TaxID=3155152 RepID=UPI00342DFFF9
MDVDNVAETVNGSLTSARRPGRGAVHHHAPSTFSLFNAAKVSRPQMLRAQVHRSRLDATLDASVRVPVTLVCAGAGWGKSVLVSAWVERCPYPVAWLTVDRGENDAQSFWAYVVAALRAAGAVPAGNPLGEWQTVPSDDDERVRALGGGLKRLHAPTVVVIDDFHEIDDPGVLSELSALIDPPPPDLHLILISRSEPLLPLHRLRLAGALGEIRARDLAFTRDEASRLLTRPGLDLGADDVAALVERTEGWAAGLQMAAAFLAGPDRPRPVTDFTGDVRPVDEYLATEVLAGQSPRMLRFLLYTSICDHVCGELADAVTGDDDGQRALEELELVNDFVVRLGAKPRWYRYHHLLREALRHHLLLRDAPMVPELHGRAARWHLARGSIFEALGHAAAGRDWPFVGRLVVSHAAPLILSANRAALMKVLRAVPAAELATTAELMVCAALLMFDAGDWDTMPAVLEGARELLRERPEEERLPTEITIRSLEMSVYRAVGDMPEVVGETTRLLATLSKLRSAQVPSAAQFRAVALNNKGVGLLWEGRPEVAERFLSSASTAARAAGVELVAINALGHLAMLEVMAGSVREAARLATTARDLAERRGWTYALQSVPAHLALVLAHIERHEPAQAERVLQQGRRAHRNEPEAVSRITWLGTQARLALAQGEPARARALVAQARRQRDSRIRAPALDRWLLLTESEIDLRTGLPEPVERRYADLATRGPLTFAERVRWAQAAFAVGHVHLAEELLAGPPPPLSETVATVEAHILTALIADSRRQGLRAGDELGRAFALAEKERLRRPFISMRGGRLERLLGRRNLLTGRPTAFVTGILQDTDAAGTGDEVLHRNGELSEREMEVLGYLPTMLTAGEIAAELGVSVNTVKAHMRSIYRKLGVARRREAVTRARAHGLI